MVIYKVIGGILTFASCSLLGLYYSFREGYRIADLNELKKALVILRSEIEFSHASLPEALAGISKRTEKRTGDFFGFLRDRLSENSGEEISVLWSMAVKEKLSLTHLAAEDFECLERFGKTLGYPDKKMQTDSIDIAIEYINSKITLLNVQNERTRRMYRSVGIVGGILIVVVLI